MVKTEPCQKWRR